MDNDIIQLENKVLEVMNKLEKDVIRGKELINYSSGSAVLLTHVIMCQDSFTKIHVNLLKDKYEITEKIKIPVITISKIKK